MYSDNSNIYAELNHFSYLHLKQFQMCITTVITSILYFYCNNYIYKIHTLTHTYHTKPILSLSLHLYSLFTLPFINRHRTTVGLPNRTRPILVPLPRHTQPQYLATRAGLRNPHLLSTILTSARYHECSISRTKGPLTVHRDKQ